MKIEFGHPAVDPALTAQTVSTTSSEVVAQVSVAASTPDGLFDVSATNPSGRKGTGNGLLLVNPGPAQELSAPSGGGAVMVVLPTGAAFGIEAGGCQAGGFGVPVRWHEAGQHSLLPVAADAGCDLTPMRTVGGTLFGRGNPVDVNLSNTAITWTPSGSGFVIDVNTVPQPPVGQRFVFDQIGFEGHFLGHARDNTLPDFSLVPFVWTEAGGWQQLQMPPGFLSCVLHDANAGLGIVGTCSGPGADQPVYWEGIPAAPVLLPLPSGATGGFGQGINTGSVIVGAVGQASGNSTAARWTKTGATWTVELLPDQGTGAIAYSINDSGWIVGDIGAQQLSRTALWTPAGVLRPLGRLELDAFCAPNSVAASAPSTPPIVGGRCRRNGAFRPVIWRPD